MMQRWFLLGLCLELSLIVPVAAQQPQIPPTIDQPQTAGSWSDEFASYDRSDLNDYPLRPIEWNNTLYSGMYHHGVAAWNGRQWLQIGKLEGRAIAITWHQNKLYAYGKLTLAGTPISLAYWAGTTWTAMPNQISYDITVTLASYDNQLYLASGHAFTIDGQAIQHLARWDGSQWQDTDVGVQGMILTMLVRPDGLYVAGSFSGITNGVVSPGILRWNGVWHSVGGGVQYRYTPQLPISVTTLASTPTQMYAIGTFDTVGNRYESSLIAAWQYGASSLIQAAPDYATTYRPQPVNVAVLANDWTIDNEALELVAVTSASYGTATISGTQILYTPNNNFQGTESLSYTLRNPARGITTTGLLTIDVLNHFPMLVPLTHTVQPNSTTIFDVLAELVNLNGDELSITQASATLGTVSIEHNQLRYVVPNQEMITATISYNVSDDHGGSQVGTIVVNSAKYQLFLPYTSK